MTPGEAELVDKIKTRGYWEIVIRPSRFVEHRLERLELFDTVASCSVDHRGWDFPHIVTDRRPHVDAEWAGQHDQWEHNLEAWRLFRSGVFKSISGLPYDWRDESGFWPRHEGWTAGTHLSVTHVIARFTEAVDFAARLSQTKAGDDEVVIAATLNGMRGRTLILDSPRRHQLRPFYTADVESIGVRRQLQRAELIARGRPVALDCAEEVFSYFQWKPAAQILSDLQKEVVEGR